MNRVFARPAGNRQGASRLPVLASSQRLKRNRQRQHETVQEESRTRSTGIEHIESRIDSYPPDVHIESHRSHGSEHGCLVLIYIGEIRMSLVSQYSLSILLYRKNTDCKIRCQSEILRFPLRADSGIHPAAVHQILIPILFISSNTKLIITLPY